MSTSGGSSNPGGYFAGHITNNVSLLVSATTTIFSTASLVAGVWALTFGALINIASTTTGDLILLVEAGTATATLDGNTQQDLDGAFDNGGYLPASATCLATVTGAGTLKLVAVNKDALMAQTALAKDNSGTYPNATGYVAWRVG